MRPATISLDHDLPPRTRPATDEMTWQVWGGCNSEGQRCVYDSDCCPLTKYTGSGKLYLRCIRNSGRRRECSFG